MKTERHRSAGGLVVRGQDILLILSRRGRWQLPRGHLETGETAAQAAVREIREETGITARIVSSLPGIEYTYTEEGPRLVHKSVDWYLLEYVAGTTEDYDSTEVSAAKWFAWEDGSTQLSFENERVVVAKARQILEGVRASEGAVADGGAR